MESFDEIAKRVTAHRSRLLELEQQVAKTATPQSVEDPHPKNTLDTGWKRHLMFAFRNRGICGLVDEIQTHADRELKAMANKKSQAGKSSYESLVGAGSDKEREKIAAVSNMS